MTTSPTARSLLHCRKQGWRAGVVEKWRPQKAGELGGRTTFFLTNRLDLFGFIDIIALDTIPGTLGIQATSTDNMAARIHKATEDTADALKDWLLAGNRFEVWGWAKRGARGKRKLWTLRVVDVELVNGTFQQMEMVP